MKRARWIQAAGWMLWVGLLVPPIAVARPAVAPSGEPPSATLGVRAEQGFLIESIRVEGNRRASSALVVGESLLDPGRSYSEEELRQASYRIHRLPFILDARFSLRKGSRPGAYELVITVEEVRRFFFGAALDALAFESPRGITSRTEVGEEETGARLTAGVRQFVGSHGVAFAAASTDRGVGLGYTHYNLFDRRVFLSAAVAWEGCCEAIFPLGLDPSVSSWGLANTRLVTLEGGVPLGGSRAVRVSLRERASGPGSRFEALRVPRLDDPFFTYRRFRERRLEARWIDDTTDDPLLPTRGRVLSAGLTGGSLASDLTLHRFFANQGGGLGGVVNADLPRYRSRYLAAVVSGVRHLPLGSRHTLSLGLRGSLGRARFENLAVEDRVLEETRGTTYEAAVSLGYAVALRRSAGRSRGDVRFEVEGLYGVEGLTPNPGFGGDPFGKLDLHAGIVYRNRWGVFRFGVRYLDAGEALP